MRTAAEPTTSEAEFAASAINALEFEANPTMPFIRARAKLPKMPAQAASSPCRKRCSVNEDTPYFTHELSWEPNNQQCKTADRMGEISPKLLFPRLVASCELICGFLRCIQ